MPPEKTEPPSTFPAPSEQVHHGLASWYSAPYGTVASREYPVGARLEVCREEHCVVVEVADYGPQEWTGRDLDLSADSYAEIAPLSTGVIDVFWLRIS